MTATYDAIVLGVGGMGSAALYELARRGRRVLGLEQYPLVHSRGSSHGHTRVIRQAYYEHPSYVPLVRRAYQRWYDLEQTTGRHLLTECGCLNIGPPDGGLVQGVRASAREHGLSVAELTAAEINHTYPAFRIPDGNVGILESGAGFLYVEDCVRAHIDAALALGATVHAEEPVVGWKVVGDTVEVRTARTTYHAARLVVTAGAWATQLLADIGVPLSVMRQVLLWFAPTDATLFRRDVFPVYLAETPTGAFYGLPAIDSRGHKAAQHYAAPELRDPDEIEWSPRSDDDTAVRAFFREYLPAADGPRTHTEVCMYTLTPDRHFVIDLHPHHRQVAVAAGFSGHGFKFASAVGEVLADLADAGRTALPIEMFRAGRFACHP
ncbi:N-methyl-L-tryptophan oxidase [Fimbriiglobus ruber]|uniref:Monomeric sarcosine oxidase n=1 Tax=Fimbriiglobus ruber TaxID=1908690 RepID=A0A225DEP6_9BACT|nr:N-methyl-L-tryptophan oxidase [Fimbriiglobus ruber]OWK34587.1 Monomeric sarcosine oxidase [Fimbriiglobus ruber]